VSGPFTHFLSKTFCQVYTICCLNIFFFHNVTIEILDKLTLTTKRGFHQNGGTSTFLPAEYTFRM